VLCVCVVAFAGELRRAGSSKGKHTSGCVKIEEKYLHAARDAGLGGAGGACAARCDQSSCVVMRVSCACCVDVSDSAAVCACPVRPRLRVVRAGMYSHMSVFKRTGADVLKPTEGVSTPGDLGGGQPSAGEAKSFLFSTGHGSRSGGAQKRVPLKERMQNRRKAVAARNSSSGAPRKKNNIRQVVQGRSRSVGPVATTKGPSFEKCVFRSPVCVCVGVCVCGCVCMYVCGCACACHSCRACVWFSVCEVARQLRATVSICLSTVF